jgi:molybdopterin/thiamine biosynthesis adenylyltransferase
MWSVRRYYRTTSTSAVKLDRKSGSIFALSCVLLLGASVLGGAALGYMQSKKIGKVRVLRYEYMRK